MRIIKYDLSSEAYGSKGKLVYGKKGTIADLIIDTGMLLWSNYDKVIPSLKTLNGIFLAGAFPCAGEWEPFEITVEEYDDLVQYLTSLPSHRPYRTFENT
ncbi:hypothetical protein [Bacillus sp. 7884-1]|uniref:hypothetical protein n=1 Tax=Bacillus sp. 7884-1 TaxID=2021693 RepID=UPI000BA6E8F4|nr:hypothetical protein [Bacillus sp. 7884-1]PAE35449.1 hypothetical protein CHI06_23680 [Bacillus sp. 7884-1]